MDTFDTCCVIVLTSWYVCSVEMGGRNDDVITNVMTAMDGALVQANTNAGTTRPWWS